MEQNQATPNTSGQSPDERIAAAMERQAAAQEHLCTIHKELALLALRTVHTQEKTLRILKGVAERDVRRFELDEINFKLAEADRKVGEVIEKLEEVMASYTRKDAHDTIDAIDGDAPMIFDSYEDMRAFFEAHSPKG